MLILYLITALSLISFGCSALQINGRVISFFSNNPILFVNIGIQKKNIGVISNERGEFSLKIPDSLIQESLTFSCIGYKSRNVLIETLSSPSKEVRGL